MICGRSDGGGRSCRDDGPFCSRLRRLDLWLQEMGPTWMNMWPWWTACSWTRSCSTCKCSSFFLLFFSFLGNLFSLKNYMLWTLEILCFKLLIGFFGQEKKKKVRHLNTIGPWKEWWWSYMPQPIITTQRWKGWNFNFSFRKPCIGT